MNNSLYVVVGRDMAVAIDSRMVKASKKVGKPTKKGAGAGSDEVASSQTALIDWLEFVIVRWGCNSSIAGSTGFAREVHTTMTSLLNAVRTETGGHFLRVVDTFSDLKHRLTEHEPIVYGHDLEVLVPLWRLRTWLQITAAGGEADDKVAATGDLAEFIRACNAKTSSFLEGLGSAVTTSTAEGKDGGPQPPPSYSRIVANPSVSILEPPQFVELAAGTADSSVNEPTAAARRGGGVPSRESVAGKAATTAEATALPSTYRQALDAIIANSRKRNLHLIRVRRHVEEEAYQAMAGKAAETARSTNAPPDTFSTMMKDVTIGLDMRLMALAGGVVGYYMCHIRGLDSGTCWIGAVVGVILMTIVDALLMIIRISKDDVRANKERRKEDARKGVEPRRR